MTRVGLSPASEVQTEDTLRAALAQSNAALGAFTPILQHLLGDGDRELLSDEVVARIRGMAHDLARQLMNAQPQPDAAAKAFEGAESRVACLAKDIMADAGILRHLHSLAIEGLFSDALHANNAVDPVLPPLLQTLISGENADLSEAAMRVLAAQARFAQNLRRMELPLGELPASQLRAATAICARSAFPDDADAEPREEILRGLELSEEESRLSALRRLAGLLASDLPVALRLEQAGIALFATAISVGARQDRDLVVVSLGAAQQFRLAVLLSAAGLSPQAIASELLALHPNRELPTGLAQLTPETSAALLADFATLDSGADR